MIPYSCLRNRVYEIYSDFIKFYPTCQKFETEILELTINRILRRLATITRETLDNYYIGQQFRVDVTIELTKAAQILQPDYTLDYRFRDRKRLKAPMAIVNNQFGTIVYH